MNFKKKLDFRLELMARYTYLYNNVGYILAYYMRKLDNIFLDKIDTRSLRVIEEFLLGMKPYYETELYIELEELKNNQDFLKIVKKGYQLLEEKNKLENGNYTFNMYTLLVNVRNFILGERVDLNNKELKLEVIDEYLRLNSYKLKGRIKSIGFDNSIFNEENKDLLSNYSYSRSDSDFGVINNAFINYFGNTKLV